MPTNLVISNFTVTICKYWTNFIIVLSLQRNYNVVFFYTNTYLHRNYVSLASLFV